jgi:shikimate dehydrogenase
VTAQPLHDSWKIAEVAEIRLLVNTTSVGLEPNDPPLFGYASLSAPIMACDLMYPPSETPLLRAARARGVSSGQRTSRDGSAGGPGFRVVGG